MIPNGRSGCECVCLARAKWFDQSPLADNAVDGLDEFRRSERGGAEALFAVGEDGHPPEAVFDLEPVEGAAMGMFEPGDQVACKMHGVCAEKQIERLVIE